MLDRGAAKSQRQQLAVRDDAVLACGESGNRSITWVDFWAYIAYKSLHVWHVGQRGSPGVTKGLLA